MRKALFTLFLASVVLLTGCSGLYNCGMLSVKSEFDNIIIYI